jgi:hypothetical protein
MSEEQSPISVYDLLGFAMDQFASIAWIKLGLQPDPATGSFDTDLAEAKVAIDIVAQMAERAAPKLDPADRREVDNLVANLRLNYVERSKA